MYNGQGGSGAVFHAPELVHEEFRERVCKREVEREVVNCGDLNGAAGDKVVFAVCWCVHARVLCLSELSFKILWVLRAKNVFLALILSVSAEVNTNFRSEYIKDL